VNQNNPTSDTQRRYARLAPIYDWMEAGPELLYRNWRELLWQRVQGKQVLEVGVGTGKNMPYYPDGAQVTAVDLTPAMLERAEPRAAKLELGVDLKLNDVESLQLSGNSFDAVVGSFIFCSVPDPLTGLKEIRRVLRPGGQLLLLEHVRSSWPLLGGMMDLFNPLVHRLMGPHINRDTVDNIRQAGYAIDHIDHMGWGDIFKLIEARNPPS
jgi:ubiquinone/menaquinone biosynthesis C-methylase UbiE